MCLYPAHQTAKPVIFMELVPYVRQTFKFSPEVPVSVIPRMASSSMEDSVRSVQISVRRVQMQPNVPPAPQTTRLTQTLKNVIAPKIRTPRMMGLPASVQRTAGLSKIAWEHATTVDVQHQVRIQIVAVNAPMLWSATNLYKK